jgi:hypothetical protein
MMSKVLLLLATTLAMPALTCGDKPASCDFVECNSNQFCDVLPATTKNCARTICKEISVKELARPCPRIILSCDNCSADEECVFSTEVNGECPKSVCKKIEALKPKGAMEKRSDEEEPLLCPEHFAPLCMFHVCAQDQKCIETPHTATECSKAKCIGA